jgi:hypothetical protein
MRALSLLIAVLFPTLGMWFGAKWTTVAAPVQNVTLTPERGAPVTGTISRTWSGEYLLRAIDGSEHRFRDFTMLSFSAGRMSRWPELFQSWRVVLCLSISVFIAIGLVTELRSTAIEEQT